MNLTFVGLDTAKLYMYNYNLFKWQYILMFSSHFFNNCQVVQYQNSWPM